MDVGAALGSPSIRTHIDGAKDLKPDVGRAADTLARVADYGAKKNVVVHLENDNPVSEDPFFIVQVIEKVNSPWLRALPDFGNSLAAHDEAFQDRAMEAMFAHAYGICHVKDGEADDEGKACTSTWQGPLHPEEARVQGILFDRVRRAGRSVQADGGVGGRNDEISFVARNSTFLRLPQDLARWNNLFRGLRRNYGRTGHSDGGKCCAFWGRPRQRHSFPGFSKWGFACGHIGNAALQIKPAAYRPQFFTRR